MDTPTLATEYGRIRHKHPDLPSKQAVLWARGNLKPLEFEWDTFVGNHLAVGKGKRDGFDIRIVVDQSDYVTSQYDFTDQNTGIRNPNFTWKGDEYSSKNQSRFIQLESDTTVPDLAKEYNKRGEARGVAWETARESLQKQADDIINGEEVEVVVTVTASIKGAVLGESSVGSVLALSYGLEMERDCDNVTLETCLVEEAIEEGRGGAVELREALAAI